MAQLTSAHPKKPCCPPSVFAASLVVLAVFAVQLLCTPEAHAQNTPSQNFLDFSSQVQPAKPPPRTPLTNPKTGQPQMLVQANEIDYDYNNYRVSAVGNVQIYYNGSTLEADRVVYDQKVKRLRAEGNARLTEADGKVTYGEVIDLTEDYRDGFIDSLRVETADETRMAATSAERTEGNYTVFQNGVYTACQPCKDDPKKPPLWQVKAARIIHNQNEKMLYFEDATLEFFGVPIGYFPYFSTPDPTVKRKTGFLLPITTTSSTYGFGFAVPYYMALAPNYDLTITPMITSKQGPMLQGEWRQRIEDGTFTVRGAGIYQLDPSFFQSDGTPLPGDRFFRGVVQAEGQFNLSPQWVWGFNGVALTDSQFFQDYKIAALEANNAYLQQSGNPYLSVLSTATSDVYLTGRGDRSYFDARIIHYQGLSLADQQSALPNVGVIDYDYVLGNPVLGGQLAFKFNFTGIDRQSASFEAISQAALNNGSCTTATADPTVKTATNCLLRGIPGTYERATVELNWQKQFIDPIGQVWKPFISLRADAATMSIADDPGVANFITPGDTSLARGMPTAGLEYRYPFISVQSWGTQTVEPIAQIILRPNEPDIGRVPNEDSQSLVFDDSNLFKVDKFSGYDRIEGGGRANAGVQSITQFNQFGTINALFGESFQLFGVNSFAQPDITNTGVNSGLDTPRSDYVGRIAYQPNRTYTFTARARFDESDLTLKRLEVESRANWDRWSLSVLYGDYAAQPELGFLTARQGILTSSQFKLNTNWVVQGAARYDLFANAFDQWRLGFGYVDDCFIVGFNYILDYAYTGLVTTPTGVVFPAGSITNNQTFMLTIALRTIGGTGSSGFTNY
ncbi:MAG: LPS-assembly protein LptD [Bradyrhizobiaceae bacterium]|nr:LPS-assembly protein LptD [Bradyrhizobiaceae bacterium]